MSQASTTSKPLTLPRIPKGLAGKVAWCIAMMPRLARASGVNLQIIGAKAVSSDGSQSRIEMAAAATTAASGDLWHNFQPYDITVTSCKIGAGTVTVPGSAAVYPCIGGTAINDASPPSLTLHATSPNYIYIKVVMAPTANGDDYIIGGGIASPASTNCIIMTSTSAQTSSGDTLYIPLSTITAGVITSRTQYTNVSLRAYDDGTSTGVAIYEQW